MKEDIMRQRIVARDIAGVRCQWVLFYAVHTSAIRVDYCSWRCRAAAVKRALAALREIRP